MYVMEAKSRKFGVDVSQNQRLEVRVSMTGSYLRSISAS